MPLLLLLACAPTPEPVDSGPGFVLEDHWTETVEICQPPSPFIRHYGARVDEEPCRAAIIADFGIDTGSFEGQEDILEDVLEGALHLMGRELPEQWSVTEDVHIEFVEQMNDVQALLELPSTQGAAYNVAASYISGIRLKPDLPFRMRRQRSSGLVSITDRGHLDGVVLAGTLFHEGVHGLLHPDGQHIDCEEYGEDGCDTSWRSAYGFQASLAAAWRPLLPTEDDWHDLWSDSALHLIRDGERVLEDEAD